MASNLKLILMAFAAVLLICRVDSSQGNHKIFESQEIKLDQSQEQSTLIRDINPDKALVVIIKHQKQLNSQSFVITINSGTQIQMCQMSFPTDLCVLNEPETSQANITIKCNSVKCDAVWEIHETTMHELSQGKIHDLYEVTRKEERLFLNLICKDISVKNLVGQLSIYTNNGFQVSQKFGSLYILFSKLQRGPIFFQISEQIEDCVSIKIIRVEKKLANEKISQGFLVGGQQYGYQPQPKQYTDLSFKISIISLALGSSNENIFVELVGISQNGEENTLKSSKINLRNGFDREEVIYVVGKLSGSYKELQLRFLISRSLILLDIEQLQTQVKEIKATEFGYFQLQKGQVINFLMPQQPMAQETDEVHISLSDGEKIVSSKKSCLLKIGCEFQIEAKDDFNGHIYLGAGDGTVEELIVLDMGEQISYTEKLPKGERRYISKTLQFAHNYKVLVNSPNVIIYMKLNQSCRIPSEQCYQDLATLKKNIIFTVDNEENLKPIFLIKALDNAQVTLSIIPVDSDKIALTDSQSFAYIMDDHEKQLKFTFKMPEQTYELKQGKFTAKSDVSFNLVAPVHSLFLFMEDEAKNTNEQQSQSLLVSSQGYFLIKKEDIKSPNFEIKVRKNPDFMDRFIHFTLVASSSHKQIRLESGSTYYETLAPQKESSSEFIFEFDKNLEYIITFYSHNAKKEDIDIRLDISPSNDWQDVSQIEKMIIDKPSDMLKLNNLSQKLCDEAGQSQTNCQLFMKLENKMDIQIDLALTLMAKHEIIELKDGLWQSFPISSISKSAHFYFQPTHADEDVTILYKTNQMDLRLSYKIFHGSNVKLNPEEWPFPSEDISDQQKKQISEVRPINQISIRKDEIIGCSPFCYVLMSLVELNTLSEQGTFSLMASNSIMELPQHEKVNILVSQEEEKIYMIDLKYALAKSKDIHLSIYHSIGVTSIMANVYSEKNLRIPYQEHTDFLLNSKENLIPIQRIKEIIEKQKMGEDNNIYLYITVYGVDNSKISLQYQFELPKSKHIKTLDFNSFEVAQLPEATNKIYKVEMDFDSQIKIVKEEGMLYSTSVICNNAKIDECLQKINDEPVDEAYQILMNVHTIPISFCQDCTLLIKIFTLKDESAKIQIHLQSEYSQIELIEGKSVYDFTNEQEKNKYSLYAVRGEKAYININTREGKIKVIVTDFEDIKMEKEGNGLISFQIDADIEQNFELDDEPEKEETQKGLLTSLELSDEFIELHVIISSAQKDTSSVYTITYSSGTRKFDLQDGMITEYKLEPDNQHKFYYSSELRTESFFMISLTGDYFQNLTIQIRHCEPYNGIIEPACWRDLNIMKPKPIKNTPHPTVIFNLPGYENYEFILKYQGPEAQTATVGISHKQFMILPYNFEYPFFFSNKKHAVFLSDVTRNGYIHIYTQQCDQSNPTLYYTNDYESFKQNDYTNEINLNKNPRQEFTTRVSPGTFYVKFTTQSPLIMMTIKIVFSQQKINSNKLVAGDKGILKYEITSSKTAEIIFAPVQCPTKEQCEKIRYQLVQSTSLSILNRQLVCPSHMVQWQKLLSISLKVTDAEIGEYGHAKLKALYHISEKDSYVSIRAVDADNNDIYYQPIQVTTLLGQLAHINIIYLVFLVGLAILGMIGFSFLVVKNARKGYTRIVQMEG